MSVSEGQKSLDWYARSCLGLFSGLCEDCQGKPEARKAVESVISLLDEWGESAAIVARASWKVVAKASWACLLGKVHEC